MLGRWMLGGALALVVTAGAADQAPIYRRMHGPSSGGGITTGSDATLGNVNATSYTTDGGLIANSLAIGNGGSLTTDGGIFSAVDAGSTAITLIAGAKIDLGGATVYKDTASGYVQVQNGLSINGGSGPLYVTGITSPIVSAPGGNTSIALTSYVNDGASAVGVIANTGQALSNSGAKLLSVRNNGTEKDYFDKDGKLFAGAGGSFLGTNGYVAGDLTVGGSIYSVNGGYVGLGSYVADGASSVGVVLAAMNNLTTVGAKLASFRNNTSTEKRAIGKNGQDVFPTGTADAVVGIATLVGGTVTVSTTAVTAGSEIQLTRNTPGGTAGDLSAPTASIVAATSFVINSASGTDTSTVNWRVTN